VRSGLGAVAAVQLADPSEALGFVKTLRQHGISGRAAGQGAMQISPSFVMTDEQITDLADGIAAALG
jgi:putrescine aminotransferase